MRNRKGGDWEFTKRNQKRKKRKQRRRNQNLSNCLGGVFPPSKRQKAYAPRLTAKPSTRGVSKPISNKNSGRITKMHAVQWRSLLKHTLPSNSEAKPTTSMKNSALRFQREQKVGAQKASLIWIPSAH